MAVSKRRRFEVLRRDNHACRYCGAAAPDVALTIDHVVPTTLGGGDDPSNLVTACVACNSGKSSVPPDAQLVDDVAADAARWSSAMKRAAEIRSAELAELRRASDEFDTMWCEYVITSGPDRGQPPPRDLDWPESVQRLVVAGLDWEFIEDAIRIAMANTTLPADRIFRYFCGVCWRELDRHREIAAALLSEAPQPVYLGTTLNDLMSTDWEQSAVSSDDGEIGQRLLDALDSVSASTGYPVGTTFGRAAEELLDAVEHRDAARLGQAVVTTTVVTSDTEDPFLGMLGVALVLAADHVSRAVEAVPNGS